MLHVFSSEFKFAFRRNTGRWPVRPAGFQPAAPVIHMRSLPRQRSETPLGAQAGMPVFRALPEAGMSNVRLPLTRYLQRRGHAAQIVEQNFHVA